MENWTVNDIKPLQDKKTKIQHTTKHLYNRKEHWADIIPELGDGYDRAINQGQCTPANLKNNNNISLLCEVHILKDHDDLYCPKYMEGLQEAAKSDDYGRVKPPNTSGKPTKKQDWAFVGSEGVFLLVREVGKENTPEVKTAYRPKLDQEEQNPTSELFYKEAVRKLQDKMSYYGD